MKLNMRAMLLWGGLIFVFFLVIKLVNDDANGKLQHVPLSEFFTRIETGDIVTVEIEGDRVRGTGTTATAVVTYQAIASDKAELIRLMRERHVAFAFRGQSGFDSVLQFWPLLFLLFMFMAVRRSQGAGGNPLGGFGKSLYTRHIKVKERFTDVAGMDEVKEEVKEVIDFLKNPACYTKLGAKIPKGILMMGPSGTGKTLLARAIAGEANVPFFEVASSSFVQMFVGVGASRVRDLFEDARKLAPCIIFMDEFDAIGRARAGVNGAGSHDEREQTLNQLLVNMDGFTQNEGVVVMAATNRPEILDAAVIRPGRFDRHVVVPRPHLKERKAILDVHAKNKPLTEDVDLLTVARGTPGTTGADLEQLLNEAAIHAAKRKDEKIRQEDIDYATYKVVLGPERKSQVLTDNEKWIVANHEAGHAVVGWMLPHADPVHKVTIIARGQALGVTLSLPVEDRVLASKNELMDQIAMTLGGRAAEELIAADPGDITSGASNDFVQATRHATNMVKRYGMGSGRVALRAYGQQVHSFLGNAEGDKDYSETTAQLIDEEIKTILEARYSQAKDILKEYKDKHDALAKALMEHETLDADALERILGPRPKKP